MVDPIGYVFEWLGLKLTGTPLGVAAANDQVSTLKDFQMLGDGGKADVERRSKLSDGSIAGRETGEDSAAGGVGECGESCGEGVGGGWEGHGS